VDPFLSESGAKKKKRARPFSVFALPGRGGEGALELLVKNLLHQKGGQHRAGICRERGGKKDHLRAGIDDSDAEPGREKEMSER